MKFKQEVEIEIDIKEWSQGLLYARESGWHRAFTHERNIPKDWPRDAIDYATRVIRENRELEKDETRLRATGEIVKMLRVNEGEWIVTSRGGELLPGMRPERLAFIEANRPKEWTVSEWGCGGVYVTDPTGAVYTPTHERYIHGDCPKEIQDITRKRIIANRPIGAHEFRPVHAPETIGVFEIQGEWAVSVHAYDEHRLRFENVRTGDHGCNEKYLEKYRTNALRMIAWCREQPAYKAWLKEYQRTHSELGEDGVLRFVDDDGDENEVRAVSGERFEWRWFEGNWSAWRPLALERVTRFGLGIQRHADAIRKLCADWEKAHTIEDVTIERKWAGEGSAPDQFKGRKFTVTFSDTGPVGGES